MADLVETSRDGETVYAVVWRAVAGDAATVEAVLAANPGLSALGPILPHSTPVTIPVSAVAPARADLLQLWD